MARKLYHNIYRLKGVFEFYFELQRLQSLEQETW